MVVILLFAVRGEVSREAEILREESHLISMLRELGCQPGGCNSVHCVTLSTTSCGWGKKSILCRVGFEIFVMECEEVWVWKSAASDHLSCLLAGAEPVHYVIYFFIVSFFTSAIRRFLFSCVIIDLDFTEKRRLSPDRERSLHSSV